MKHLYEADGIVHSYEGGHVDSDTYIVWTKCEIDVPANKSFKSNEAVTCDKCMSVLIRQGQWPF